jgi:hypothetical protein
MICNLTPLKLLYKTGMSSTLLCFLSKVGPRGLPSKKDSHNDPEYFGYMCQTLVERETLVRAFSPGSTLEPGLKAFRRRGPKCSLETPPL